MGKWNTLLEILAGKQHIIWDWNGTLLSDVDHAVKVVNTILAENNLPEINRESYRQVFDFPVRSYYETLGFDFTKVSFEELSHQFVDRFMSGVYELKMVPGAQKLLNEIHAKGIKQSILSASDQENLDQMMKGFGIEKHFSHVVGISNKLAASKVESGKKLLEMAKIEKAATVLIGDTLHDLEVAEALGISALLVGHGHQCTTRLKSRHSWVVEEIIF